MDANAVVAAILGQDARRTRTADERSFFQVLRAALEREARRGTGAEGERSRPP